MRRWRMVGGIGAVGLAVGLIFGAALLIGCESGSQQFACTPTHFQDVSCSVVGMEYPWTLQINGSHVEAVGMFSCDGTWTGNMFKCLANAGLDAPPEGCEFDLTKNSDGSIDTGLYATGTDAHCVPQ